jgi:hypothetical protein
MERRNLPRKKRELPRGRCTIESADPGPSVTPSEERGLEEAITALDRGEGIDLEDVRLDLDTVVRG